MHKLKLVNLLSITTLLLFSCGNRHVDIVKNSDIPINKRMEYGNALNKRKVCRKVEWSELENDKGETVVTYKCFFIGAPDYFKNLQYKYLKRAEIMYERSLSSAKITREMKYKEIGFYSKKIADLQTHKAELETELKRLEAIDKERADIYAKYDKLKVDGRYSPENWKKLKVEIEQLDKKYPKIELSQVRFNTTQQKSQLDENKVKLKEVTRLLPSKSTIEKNYKKAYGKAEKSREVEVQEANTRYALSDAYEFYQWSFNDQQKPTIIKSGYSVIKLTGEVIEEPYAASIMLQYAYSDNIDSMKNYYPLTSTLTEKLGLKIGSIWYR